MVTLLFNQIFIENDLRDDKETADILSKIPAIKSKKITYINRYDEIFGKVKKPYLEKRSNLNLFIAHKKGALVKKTPDAYGIDKEEHFYFINAYNCIYECEYCYLQGFFNSPDLVIFTNWREIQQAISKEANKNPGCWFHAGEFSDSLALSHLTNEIQSYYELFKKLPNEKLELRTKSANTKVIEQMEPLNNIYISYSISTSNTSRKVDHRTPNLNHRLEAIKHLQKIGHKVALHLDPIIWTQEWYDEHSKLIDNLNNQIDLQKISYISLGVVRFTDDVYYQFKKNYPKSIIHQGELKRSFDNKIRYPKALRSRMLKMIKDKLIQYKLDPNIIYECME